MRNRPDHPLTLTQRRRHRRIEEVVLHKQEREAHPHQEPEHLARVPAPEHDGHSEPDRHDERERPEDLVADRTDHIPAELKGAEEDLVQ